LRIAVIGCGSIGRRHLINLRSLGERDIHVFDHDIAVQESLIAGGKANIYGTMRDLWRAKPEVVLICTPPQDHVPLAIEAAKRGCAIFIEKPLSCSMDGVPGLIEITEKTNAITMVGCNWRFAAPVKRMLGKVDSSNFTVYAHVPPLNRAHDSMWDVGVHFIDLALSWAGPASLEWVRVTGNTIHMWMYHDSGPCTRLNFDAEYPYGLMLTRGSGAMWRWNGEDSRWPWGFKRNGMYVAEMRHFLECVKSGEGTCNPISDAAQVLRIALEAREWQLQQP